MKRILKNKEIESVLVCSASKRAKYFFNEICMSGMLWVVFTEGNILELKSSNGQWMIPVWPYEDYAKKFVKKKRGILKNIHTEKVAVKNFITNVKKMISEEFSTIGIFPGSDDTIRELKIEEFEEIYNEERRRFTVDPNSLNRY